MIKLGKATIDFFDEPAPYVGKPMNVGEGAPEEQLGSVTKFRVTTSDQLNYVFGIVEWPEAEPEVTFLDATDGDSKYERLQRAGRLSIMPNSEGFWLIDLRAMKYNPERDRTNLAGATLDNLDSFLDGDVKQALKELGAFGLGTRNDLVRDNGPKRNQLCFTCAPGNHEVVAAAFVITRVLAVMKDYGQN